MPPLHASFACLSPTLALPNQKNTHLDSPPRRMGPLPNNNKSNLYHPPLPIHPQAHARRMGCLRGAHDAPDEGGEAWAEDEPVQGDGVEGLAEGTGEPGKLKQTECLVVNNKDMCVSLWGEGSGLGCEQPLCLIINKDTCVSLWGGREEMGYCRDGVADGLVQRDGVGDGVGAEMVWEA